MKVKELIEKLSKLHPEYKVDVIDKGTNYVLYLTPSDESIDKANFESLKKNEPVEEGTKGKIYCGKIGEFKGLTFHESKRTD